MAFIELNIYSESIGTAQQVYIIMPQKSNKGEIGIEESNGRNNIKTLYLLHGLSDNHTTWLRRTSIERYASERNLCVVMPFAGKSFYTNMKHGDNYYTYVSKELPGIIETMFNVSKNREDRFIAGNSMGGYGALKIGMRECDRFSACAGLSSVADIKRAATMFGRNMKNIFGSGLDIDDSEDLFCLAEKTAKNTNRLRIFMGVGTEDSLYNDNIKLKEKISSLNYDFTFKESNGGHNWYFWDEYIRYVLDWFFEK